MPENQTPKSFRIFSPDGDHVATVKPEMLEESLAYWNTTRQLNIYGEPIGEFRAEAYNGYIAGDR